MTHRGTSREATRSSDQSVRDAVLGVNGRHNVVQVLTGVVGPAMARRFAREFALGFGIAYLALSAFAVYAATSREQAESAPPARPITA